MTRALWLLVALAACDNSGKENGSVFDIDEVWQVHCPSCTYPEHAINGTIDVDNNPNMFEAGCSLTGGILDVHFGQATYIYGQETMPGYDMRATLGYDPATGFDLGRQCQINVAEADGRQWGATCSDIGDCHIVPTVADGGLSFTMRCAGMASIPFQAGNEATLEGRGISPSEISATIWPCSL